MSHRTSPTRTFAQCPHELRPGIKSCLHCMRDARLADRARRFGLLKRIALGLLTVMVLAGVGASGLYLLRNRNSGTSTPRLASESGIASAAQPETHNTAPVSVAAPSPAPESVSTPVQPVSAEEVVRNPAVASFSPVIAEGLTQLSDGINAMRSGDTVTVSFNTPMLRTRRPEKFEGIVRRTLAGVYGAKAASLLASIPTGSLVQVQDLFADLPTRGLRIAIPAGGTIALWPETKEGKDGPLVVAYRATVTR